MAKELREAFVVAANDLELTHGEDLAPSSMAGDNIRYRRVSTAAMKGGIVLFIPPQYRDATEADLLDAAGERLVDEMPTCECHGKIDVDYTAAFTGAVVAVRVRE